MISTRIFRLKTECIWYLHFVIESYEGLATVTTMDRHTGVIAISFPQEQEGELSLLLESLAETISLEELALDDPSVR